MTKALRGGPLQGVRVVEITKVWAGPYAGKLLAYLGAEAIRVESIGSLDVTRIYGVDDVNNAPGFMAVNPQKLSVQIDMKTEKGLALLLDLIRQADIVIENLRPGAMERLGLGYEQVKKVKPDIVYVSMSMFGNQGPLAYQTGYAPCFAALGGLSALVGYEGEPPTGMNIRYADSTVGALSAYAAVVALLHRRRTGEGQYIDVSAVECMTSMIGDAVMDFMLNGVERLCDGNRHAEMAPHGIYPCQGGDWISIAATNDDSWRALAEEMGQGGLAVDERFSTLAARKANEDELDRLVAAGTAARNAEALSKALQKRGVAAGKSQNSIDLIADQRLWARGLFQYVDDGQGGSRPVIGPSWRMSRGASLERGAPRLGEHNAYIFGEVLGLSETAQRELAEAGAIR